MKAGLAQVPLSVCGAGQRCAYFLLRLGIGDRRGKGKAALRLLSGLKVFSRTRIEAKGDHKRGGLVGVLRVPAGAFELVACRGSCAWRREEKD
jgi:hypothetical protein